MVCCILSVGVGKRKRKGVVKAGGVMKADNDGGKVWADLRIRIQKHGMESPIYLWKIGSDQRGHGVLLKAPGGRPPSGALAAMDACSWRPLFRLVANDGVVRCHGCVWILRCVTFIFVARTNSGHMGAPTRVYFTGDAEARSSENLSSEKEQNHQMSLDFGTLSLIYPLR